MMKNPLCAIIVGPTLPNALEQIELISSKVSLLEFRLDLFSFHDIEQIRRLKDSTNLPVIFTMRLNSHGGSFTGSEQERLEIFKHLLKLNPTYIDLEIDSAKALFEIVKPHQLICSLHNFKETPSDLEALLNRLKIYPAAIYKVACMANSGLDALRMLSFIQKYAQTGLELIGICMGEDGTSTRILGNIYGNTFTYAPVNAQHCVAPGQLDIDTLMNTYHFDRHNAHTTPFGVIGNPISHSIGHIKHNTSFRKMGVDAVYVKMRIPSEDLAESMKLFPRLNFGGLSVTMPLKELSLKFMDSYDDSVQSIEALNTIVIRSQVMKAYNTDGEAAVQAILAKTALKNKRVIMLGAGGAAKAILHYLKRENAELIILNRTLEKAQELAKKFGGRAGTLEDFDPFAAEGYDVLINSTSVGREPNECPIAIEHLLTNKVVMEVISSEADTRLIQEAKKRNCTIVYGLEMYERQAEKQLDLWFRS